MKKNLYVLYALVAAVFCNIVFADSPKIAIVGDSISQGIGIPEKQREKLCYPAQLADILGDACTIKNCSLRGSNVTNKGFRPYMKQKCYAQALDFKPDVVIILLGANDGNPRNWVYKEDFERDYNAIIDSFASLDSKPEIILGIPLPCFRVDDPKSIDGNILRKEVTPIIEKIAKKRKLRTIDFYSLFIDKQTLLPDCVHPNVQGAKLMAEFLADWLVKNGIVKK